MQTSPLVSIIIPVYNAEPYIDECIRSAQKQDYPNTEIIVIDDASTDESMQHISKYSGLLFLKNEKNLGECKTCSIAYAHAKGTYLCRLTGDDAFVNSNHLSIQVAEMEKNNLDWCYNNISLIGETTTAAVETFTSWVPLPLKYSPRWFWIFDNLFLKFPNICYLILGLRGPMNTNAVMIRASSYHQYLTWYNQYGTYCDHIIYEGLFLHKLKGRAIHSIGAFWRVHPNQNTQSTRGKEVLKKLRLEMYSDNKNFPLWMRIACRFLKRRIQ